MQHLIAMVDEAKDALEAKKHVFVRLADQDNWVQVAQIGAAVTSTSNSEKRVNFVRVITTENQQLLISPQHLIALRIGV